MIDPNVLSSALLSGSSLPAHLITLWREGRFDVLASGAPLNELTRVTRYPKLREHLARALAGRLINQDCVGPRVTAGGALIPTAGPRTRLPQSPGGQESSVRGR